MGHFVVSRVVRRNRKMAYWGAIRQYDTMASLLTGPYPHQAGIGLMTSDRDAKYWGAGDRGETFPSYRGC